LLESKYDYLLLRYIYIKYYFSIFGFASLFGILPTYGIYESKCKTLSERIISNETMIVKKECSGQIGEYQVWLIADEFL
jgi:hypothetical protein